MTSQKDSKDTKTKGPAQSPDASPPALAALFLIKFDVKVGYTIAWQKTSSGVNLEGVIEYKSLPSGLHNIKEDLVYFTYQKYAGLSAFVNGTADAKERNARFVAVGVLVPLKDGRLGRSWLHAANLKELARELVKDSDKTEELSEYWEKYRMKEQSSSADEDPYSSTAQRRSRALSTATATSANEQELPSFHPARSILDFLDTFGPLVFALHRQALLRRRILVVSRPPMHSPCDFVYDLSILSSLPLSLAPVIQLPTESHARFRPLFNVGIHDIDHLENLNCYQKRISQRKVHRPSTPTAEADPDQGAGEAGWVACTSDEILTVKSHLYDVLVEMPNVHGNKWPSMKKSRDGPELKATQRDLRRYKSLQRALRPVRGILAGTVQNTEERYEDQQDDEHSHLLFKSTSQTASRKPDPGSWSNGEEEKLTESTSWSELAYSSFIWWASAGEREEAEIEEDEMDEEVLSDLSELAEQLADEDRYTDESPNEGHGSRLNGKAKEESRDVSKQGTVLETAVIAYFHRLTKQLFESAADLFVSDEYGPQQHHSSLSSQTESGSDSSEGEEQDGDQDKTKLRTADLRRLGLDIWSQSSRDFVKDFAELWFGMEVEIKGMAIECCGMRIC